MARKKPRRKPARRSRKARKKAKWSRVTTVTKTVKMTRRNPSTTAPAVYWYDRAESFERRGRLKSALANYKRARTQAKRDGNRDLVVVLEDTIADVERKIGGARTNPGYYGTRRRTRRTRRLRSVRTNPLRNGSALTTVKYNIRKLYREGHPVKQAVAIALKKAGLSRYRN